MTRAGPVLTLLLALFATDAAAAEHRILFVGNSYTDYGGATNVAGCYGPLASEGVDAWDSVAHETVAKGGWTFHKHAQDASSEGQELHALLGAGDTAWDVVVFQEQSQIPGFHPYNAPDWDLSIAAAPTLDSHAAAAGAETVFMMTWGRRDGDPMNPEIFPDYPSMQALLAEGYALYAAGTSTPARRTWVAPVGMAWYAVWSAATGAGQDPLAPEALFARLYSGDGSHPSQLGSYLMGLAMVASLTGRDPGGLTWAPGGIGSEDRAALQAAVRSGILTPPFETVDYGWGPLHRLPWLHAWEDPADGAGPVLVSHPIRRDTAVVDGPATAPSIILGGENGALGRLVLQGEAALSVDEIAPGAEGSGAVDVVSGALMATTVGVPLTLSGGGWILPSTGVDATLSAALMLGDGAVLRFDLGALPGEGAPNAHLTVTGAATLDGRIYVVPTEELVSDEATTWELLAAASIEALPNLELDGPDGAAMEIVDGGPGQVLRVTLPATATPPIEAAPDVVTGEDTVVVEVTEEVTPGDGTPAPDMAPDTGVIPDMAGRETPPETAGADAVVEPAPAIGGGGGCGVGAVGSGWWLVLSLLLVWRPVERS